MKCPLLRAFTLLCVVGCSDGNQSSLPGPQERADSVDRALRESRIDDAIELSNLALLKDPSDPDRLTDAARSIAAGGDQRKAADLLVDAAKAAGFKPTSRVVFGVQALLQVGEVYGAIDLLSAALESDPTALQLRRLLFGLLGEAGRTDRMLEHYEVIVRERHFDLPVLLAMTDTSQRLFSADTMEMFIQRNVKDHRLRLGVVHSLRDEKRFDEAETVLREIVAAFPRFSPALALLGRMPSVQSSTELEFAQWRASALPYCRDQADFWIALGDRYAQPDDPQAALAFYVEAARINPNMVIPWTQISLLLRTNQESGKNGSAEIEPAVASRLAKACDQRAMHLVRLRDHLQRFGGNHERSQTIAADVARSLHSLGRRWEAEAWAAIATTLPEDPEPDLTRLRNEIITELKSDQRWQSTLDLSALHTDTGHSLMAIDSSAGVRSSAAGGSPSPAVDSASGHLSVPVRLVDETKRRNLTLPETKVSDIASSLVDTLGMGGGTIDFDRNGQPDLMFCIGELDGGIGDGTVPEHSRYALLRNQDAEFVDVSVSVRCGNAGPTQAVAIGDYNEDGFSDVFFANVGANRLVRNMGDGTFSDDTDTALLDDDSARWSTGGAFCDLDGDGISDLFALSYCDLDSGVDQPCQTPEGPAPCHPAKFPADRDQLLLGDGTGQLRAADRLGAMTLGRGLGILAGRLANDSQYALVANDMSANHLYRITGQEISEIAVPSGTALDGQSLPQASMGMAHGDFDGDLDLDFYVTGFAREYNIYYEQVSPGIWADKTAQQGLIKPTLMTVGFGVQAIDLDGDGNDEFSVTNGHIGDFGEGQPALEQPFQLFRRSATGRFESIRSTGNVYGEGKHIGRALWKVDVDNDMRDDLIITHQNKPPTLLANRTDSGNHRFGVRFVGTKSSRDAVGAVVHFTAAGRRRAMWLLAGDGYMSSNQRVLRAGVGTSTHVEDVTVTWPSGLVESYGNVAADRVHLFVEGSGKAFADSLRPL